MHAPPVWRNLNFLALWLGLALTALGDAITFIAIPFVLINLTGTTNPALLAQVLLVMTFPRFGGAFLGLILDRIPLKAPLMLTSAARALLFAGLATYLAAGGGALWPVYLFAFLNGLLALFSSSVANVLVPELITPQQPPRANSLMQAAATGRTAQLRLPSSCGPNGVTPELVRRRIR